jgi:hypothetical protein
MMIFRLAPLCAQCALEAFPAANPGRIPAIVRNASLSRAARLDLELRRRDGVAQAGGALTVRRQVVGLGQLPR